MIDDGKRPSWEELRKDNIVLRCAIINHGEEAAKLIEDIEETHIKMGSMDIVIAAFAEVVNMSTPDLEAFMAETEKKVRDSLPKMKVAA